MASLSRKAVNWARQSLQAVTKRATSVPTSSALYLVLSWIRSVGSEPTSRPTLWYFFSSSLFDLFFAHLRVLKVIEENYLATCATFKRPLYYCDKTVNGRPGFTISERKKVSTLGLLNCPIKHSLYVKLHLKLPSQITGWKFFVRNIDEPDLVYWGSRQAWAFWKTHWGRWKQELLSLDKGIGPPTKKRIHQPPLSYSTPKLEPWQRAWTMTGRSPQSP